MDRYTGTNSWQVHKHPTSFHGEHFTGEQQLSIYASTCYYLCLPRAWALPICIPVCLGLRVISPGEPGCTGKGAVGYSY
jgi:hypothetical protein